MNYISALTILFALFTTTSSYAGGRGGAFFTFGTKNVRLTEDGVTTVRTAKSISILGTSSGANTYGPISSSSWIRIRAVFEDGTHYELNVRSFHPLIMASLSGVEPNSKLKTFGVECATWNWEFYSKDSAGSVTAWVNLAETASEYESGQCSLGTSR